MPVPEIPAAFRHPDEVVLGQGVNGIFAVALNKNPVGVCGAKAQAGDGAVGIAGLGAEDNRLSGRVQAEARQIRRGVVVLHKLGNVETVHQLHKILNFFQVHREFFARDLPVVGALVAEEDIFGTEQFDFIHRRDESRQQMRIAEIIHRAAPGGQHVGGHGHDGVQPFAPGIDLVRIVRGGLAGVDGGEQIGVATEPDIELRRLQAVAGQVGARIVRDKTRTLGAAERLEQGGDVFGIGPGGERAGDAPEMIAGIAVQFDGLGAIGDDNPVDVGGAADERGVPPVIHGMREHLEPRGIGHKDRIHADHADIDLIAERGEFADAQLPLLVAGIQGEGEPGIGETVFRIRVFGVG